MNRIILGWTRLVLGDKDGALPYGQRVIELVNTGNPLISTGAMWQVIEDLFIGDAAQALERLGDIEKEYEGSAISLYYGPIIWDLIMQVALANGQYQRTIELADEMIARQRSINGHLFLSDTLREKGLAMAALGRQVEGYQALLEARLEAREQNSRRSLWQILIDLVKLSTAVRGQGSHDSTGLGLVTKDDGSAEDGALSGMAAETILTADDFRREAREVIGFIAEHISDAQLHAAFLALPDVRMILGEDL